MPLANDWRQYYTGSNVNAAAEMHTEIDSAVLGSKAWKIKATTYDDDGKPTLIGLYPIPEEPSENVRILFNQHRDLAIEALSLEEEIWKEGDIVALNFKYEGMEVASISLKIKLSGPDSTGGTLATRHIRETDKRQFAAVLKELERYRSGYRSLNQGSLLVEQFQEILEEEDD